MRIYNSVTAYNCRSLSLFEYNPSLAIWSWIFADLNCVCVNWALTLRCNDLNWTFGWNVVRLSCQAPRWSDLKFAGFKGVSTHCEIVVGTFGTAGCFLFFSSGSWGNGLRPNELYFWMLAVRCCWSSVGFCCCCWRWSNLKPLKLGNSQADLEEINRKKCT